MRRNRFPPGWTGDRVRKVLEHCEQQSEDVAVAEDDAALRLKGQAAVEIPKRLARNKSLITDGGRSYILDATEAPHEQGEEP
jgi:hypothetical protein